MKRGRPLILLAMLLALAAAPAWAADWPEASQTLLEQAREDRLEAGRIREAVASERRETRAELEALRAGVAAGEQAFEAAKSRLEALQAQEKRLRSELEDSREEHKTLEGAVRAAAKSLQEMGRIPGDSSSPEGSALLQRLVEEQSFPGFDAIRALVDECFRRMRRSGRLVRGEGEIVGPQGELVPAEVLWAGPFTGYYRLEDGEVGLLDPTATGAKPAAAAGSPSWSMAGLIEDFLDGHGDELPLDVSRGAALKRLKQGNGPLEWLEAGGWLVWPILAAALVAAVLGAERLAVLFRLKADSDAVVSQVLDLARSRRLEECRGYCAARRSTPACRVLERTLAVMGEKREAVETALQEALLGELPRLERFLPTLSVLAAVAPLLGLLGTVTGMIETFQSITLFGAGDPRMMSGGISEALVTTQLGLAVAVPVMVLHHVLERRVDRILADMEEKGAALAVVLKQDAPGA
jgi:biopolymer transport protein ExbB